MEGSDLLHNGSARQDACNHPQHVNLRLLEQLRAMVEVNRKDSMEHIAQLVQANPSAGAPGHV